MSTSALYTYEQELLQVIADLQQNKSIDMQPLASKWRGFLTSLKTTMLSHDDQDIFIRALAHFKIIETLIADQMNELVMAKVMSNGSGL